MQGSQLIQTYATSTPVFVIGEGADEIGRADGVVFGPCAPVSATGTSPRLDCTALHHWSYDDDGLKLRLPPNHPRLEMMLGAWCAPAVHVSSFLLVSSIDSVWVELMGGTEKSILRLLALLT